MGRRIEAPGGIWLVRLHGCADRLRHRVYISRPTPPLEREATERHDGEETAQHRLAVALAKSPDEGRPKHRPVLGGVAIVEHDALAADPAVQAGRVPRPSVDGGLESRPGLGGRAAAGERHGLHERSSPRSTVTACPPSITRSPASRTRTTPPRGEA